MNTENPIHPTAKNTLIFNAGKGFPSKAKLVLITVSALSLIIVVVSASYYYLNLEKFRKLSKTNLPSSTVEISPTPTETETQELLQIAETAESASSTANWRRYINTRVGYSIRYPDGWVVKSYGQIDSVTLDQTAFNPTKVEDKVTPAVRISYSIKTYDEQLALGATASTPIILDTVGGVKKETKDSAANIFLSIILPLNSNTLVFLAKIEYEAEFNLMLSTFKFTQ